MTAVDLNRFVLLSDLHIDADPAHVEGGVNMTDSFTRVRDELLALDPRPAAVLVCGDCAHHWGKEADYAAYLELARPLREAGLPIVMAMGNHDDRHTFWQFVGRDQLHLKDRHVSVVESPLMDWYVLDSLEVTNDIPGSLGETQLQWLAARLDEKPDKPAIVMVHHQPDDRPVIQGLKDTKQLLDVLSPRRQVKALIFGHTHRWERSQDPDGLHRINLPTTAYIFREGQPTGWTDVRLRPGGATLELNCCDPTHTAHLQKVDLMWR
jgi:3',5'-cyclic-AMP phosphodiesterase